MESHSKGRKGFTVVELLAAMVVSSLVVAFVLSMYLFSERIMAHEQRVTDVKSMVSICTQTLIRDIESDESVVQWTDTSLVLSRDCIMEDDSSQEVFYRFIDGNVTRNKVIVNDPGTLLYAKVAFTMDTVSIQPLRLWDIRVIGWRGKVGDSASVQLTVMLSSQELVSRIIGQSMK